MTSSSFYEEGSKLLTPGAFEFVLDSELKRAVRSQNFLTLVIVEAAREWEGMMVTADDGTVQEVASLIGKVVFFCWFFIWVRWTIPRFRYDQVMRLGWKVMLPLSLLNIFVTGLILLLYDKGGF